MNRIIEAYSELKTEENLPENWIKRVWVDNGFAKYVSFPTEYDVFLDEVVIGNLLNEFYEAIKNWFRTSGLLFEEIISNYSNNDNSDNDFNWQTLINEGINYKSLICLVGTLILRFIEDASNLSFLKDALLSARLYLFFVAIPGSHICQIFNSTLYSHVMTVIKISCEQLDESVINKGKGVKRKKGGLIEDIADDSDYSSNRTPIDKMELIKLLNDFLSKLKLIIENKKLKFDVASLNLTIQILVMMTRLDKMSSQLLFNNVNNYRRDSLSYLSYKSFMILLSLSKMLDNNPQESIKHVIQELLPMFLVNEMRSLGLAGKDALILQNNYVSFLKLLLESAQENSHEALNILVQRICVAVPDRAESRSKAVGIVLDILTISPPDLLSDQLYSIIFMSHMNETKIRLITLEIISKLLLELESSINFEQLPQKYIAVTNERFLLAIIFYRCQDAAVSVRTKALSYLDQLISCDNVKMKRLVQNIFVEPYINCDDFKSVIEYSKPIFDTHNFLLNEQNLDDDSINVLPGVKVILDMLVNFSQEDKVFIKKSAIQTLATIFLCNWQWISKDLLNVFLIACDDSSVLIRKTTCQLITDLLMAYPNHNDVIQCWVKGLVPMVAEEEIKAQEKVLEHFSKIILNNTMIFNHTTSVISRLPWVVMKEILSYEDNRPYFHFAVVKWVQSGAIKSRTIPIIYSHIDTDNNWIAWSLLHSLAQCIDLPNPEFVYDYYLRILSNVENECHSQIVLETLYYVCPSLSKEIKMKLLKRLESDLDELHIPLKLISGSRNICELIITDLNRKSGHAAVVEWSTEKILNCLNYIKNQIGKNAPINVENSDLLIKHIFLLGELAQAVPKKVTKSDLKMLQSVILSVKNRENGLWEGKVSTAVKAIVVLTLTKLVLQKEDTVSSIMPMFKEILNSSSVDSSIQVNTIISMCDLCSRYTTLVERYFTAICRCFNSKHECVRKTALVSVIKRVKEEYVKLRPFILFPMLTMILDKSEEIRHKIASFIGVDLKKKNNILETYYTGLFFFMNNCKNHSTTVKIPDDIRTIFSLTDRPADRQYIYIYILDKLADNHKRLLICKKIVLDIMAVVAEDSLKFDEKIEVILIDAFNVLSDNEKKLSDAISRSKRINSEDGDDIEDIETNREGKKSHVPAVTENTRLVEANEIMPIFLKLRLVLKKRKSKCMKYLVAYLCELMKNFKNEMADLLCGDNELKAEIEHNLRKMEQDETVEQHEENNQQVKMNVQNIDQQTENQQEGTNAETERNHGEEIDVEENREVETDAQENQQDEINMEMDKEEEMSQEDVNEGNVHASSDSE